MFFKKERGRLGGGEQGTVRIHAVLASPQQLHQYRIQLRNWQRSSVLRFQARTEKQSNSHNPSAQCAAPAAPAAAEGDSERGRAHTHVHSPTHSLTHWSLCCIKRKKRSAEEGTEGHADWEYSSGESQSGEGEDCEETRANMLPCSAGTAEHQGV